MDPASRSDHRRLAPTGAGILISPGGGFFALSISLEATELATWLQQRGVAAFVLKDRTIVKKLDGVARMDMDTAGRYGIAHGIQALKVVRAHAKKWGLDRSRIGMKHQGTDSDHWIDDYARWLRARGVTSAISHPRIPASAHVHE